VEVFGNCGLICDLHQFQPDSHHADGKFCAFVKYYTKRAAQRASFEYFGYKFNGVSCKVTIAKKEGATNSNSFANRDLPLSKSIELLNYYYGFDQWSTRVAVIKQVHLQKETEGDLTSCEYQCEVLLTLKDGRKVRGVGAGKYAGKEISMILENTQKFAVTNARKNAFQKLVIVVLGSGKAAVHALDEEKETTEAQEEKDELDLYNPHPQFD